MSRKLYLECSSGISGDMFVGAMLDLGADKEVLERALHSLELPGFKINISRASKSGLDTCDFQVVLDKQYENHDHDMEYLHGVKGALAKETGHPHDENEHFLHHEETEHHHNHIPHRHREHDNHHCEHDNHHHEHHNHHEHRNLEDILTIINRASLCTGAKKTAVRIFEILAEAEARAHGVPIEEVHFHEVGAVDSIVDIAAAAVCLDNLGIEEVVIPSLQEGTGFVRCQHGMIPVPVPAVAAIAQEHGLILHITDMKGEFVTPTGAAIAAAIKTTDKLPELFTIERTGIGAGKREYARPSILRAMLIQEKETECNREEKQDYIWKLESTIDDCTGEVLGYVMELLFEAGARDVHYTPVFMKKNRPGYQLNVLCREEDIERLEEIIFAETTTIGIRRQRIQRSILKREIKEVETSIGAAAVKVCKLLSGQDNLTDEKRKRIYPEYESVARLSRLTQMPWQDVYQLIVRECYDRV